MKKKVKEPKLSPFAKLRAELEEQKRQTREWRDKYRATMEGKLESIESSLEDISRQIDDSHDGCPHHC